VNILILDKFNIKDCQEREGKRNREREREREREMRNNLLSSSTFLSKCMHNVLYVSFILLNILQKIFSPLVNNIIKLQYNIVIFGCANTHRP
jgi:hypothetical protein